MAPFGATGSDVASREFDCHVIMAIGVLLALPNPFLGDDCSGAVTLCQAFSDHAMPEPTGRHVIAPVMPVELFRGGIDIVEHN